MANLSNINNKFLVTTTGEVLVGQTTAIGSSIFQVTGNSTFSGNVGIGVAAHSTYALDIQGTSGLALRFYNGTTFKSGIAAVTTAGEMIAGSVVDDFAIRANAGNMLFATNGNVERMRIDSSGNLLLNQASSRIKGGGSTTGRLEISNSDSKSYMMITGSARPSASNLIYFVNDAAVTLTLNQDNSATFAGNVTITGGTTSGLNITTSGTQDTININRAANNDNAITKYQTASTDKWIVGLRNTGDDNFRFYSYGTSSDVLTIDQASGDKTFISSYGGGTFPLRVGYGTFASFTPTFVIDDTGSVGIGTDSPDATLELYNMSATSDGDGSSTETLSGQDSLLLQAAGGGVGTTTGSITWRAGSRRRAMITSVQENADGDYQGISFYTQGTDGPGDMFESMRIAHSGDVGINTTSPGAKLHTKTGSSNGAGYDGSVGLIVEGATRSIVQINSTSDAYLMFGDAAQLNRAWFGYNHTTDQLMLHTGSTIYMDGNVGIGTTLPQNILHLKSNDPKVYLEDGNAGTNEKVYVIYPAGSQYVLQTQTDAYGAGQQVYVVDRTGTAVDSHKWYTNNILRMRIASDGGAFVSPGTGSYGLSMNDTNQVMNSGYSNGNQTVSLTYTCTTMSSMSIECVFNHYGYVTSYGCARVATFAVGPVITIQNILEITTPNGGSWTFNRVSNTEFTVVKTAGTYAGGGRWFVKINGARVFAA